VGPYVQLLGIPYGHLISECLNMGARSVLKALYISYFLFLGSDMYRNMEVS